MLILVKNSKVSRESHLLHMKNELNIFYCQNHYSNGVGSHKFSHS